MDVLLHLRSFARVVETGSFTAVASELRTTQPTISRQIAALEAHLGVRLFTRTTRSLTLTEDGREFYEHACRAIEAVDEAEDAVRHRKARAAGLLRLACPIVLGRLHIIPHLPAFLQRNPDVRVEMLMNDGFADLVEEGIDLAIRVGEVTDLGLVARRIGTTRRVTVASPDYLAARGTPTCPDDLAAHDCIVYTRLLTNARWIFESPNGPISVDVKGRFLVNSSEGVREAVLCGLGVAVIPVWAFRDEIASKRVTVLLDAFEPKRLPIHAVYPSRRFVPAKVRAMIDFLAHEFALVPQISTHELEP